jgi:DNA-binding HxlR family transcriptional regulator
VPRLLAGDRLGRRTTLAEVPPRVEYSLTPAGAALNAAVHALAEWGTRHGRPARAGVTGDTTR